MDKEVTGYLVKTESARNRHLQEDQDLETRRKDAQVLGESEQVVHAAVAAGVQGLPKPARPKVALGQLVSAAVYLRMNIEVNTI